MSQPHEHDLGSIEQIIRQAKEKRATQLAEILGPALKTVGGLAFVVVIVPWQAVRNTLTPLGS